MSRDLMWAGAWRKLGPNDGMGIVRGVVVASGATAAAPTPAPRPAAATGARGTSEQLAVKAEQMERPFQTTGGFDPPVETRPNGRVRIPRNG